MGCPASERRLQEQQSFSPPAALPRDGSGPDLCWVRRPPHPFIYSDGALVLLSAANSGNCRVQSANAWIFLSFPLACPDKAAAHSREMVAASDFTRTRSQEHPKGLGA